MVENYYSKGLLGVLVQCVSLPMRVYYVFGPETALVSIHRQTSTMMGLTAQGIKVDN